MEREKLVDEKFQSLGLKYNFEQELYPEFKNIGPDIFKKYMGRIRVYESAREKGS
jgi:hypothetical protein